MSIDGITLHRSKRRRRAIPLTWGIAIWLAGGCSALAAAPADLNSLSIEELVTIEISSVSKRAEPLSDAAAAVYVITRDDIIRSGATTIPEMLRLAPNLDVAQISANSYAISARGFNGNISDKLLVLIDGRSIYTPIFAGVYWDMQYVPPDDIDQIEVTSGPGGTLWGANAVNGVINIITRKSSDTQGGIADVGVGTLSRDANLQFGGRINDDLTYRVYGGLLSIDHNDTSQGISAADGWHKSQGGFRLDWSRSSDLVTLQGDIFGGREEQPGTAEQSISGGNLLTRWNHTFAGGSALQVQAYYDDERRFVPSGGGGDGDQLNSYDLDIQYSFSLNSWNAFVWGGGERIDKYKVFDQPGFVFSPNAGTLHYANVFAEDTMSITDRVKLIAGIKLEDDAYVGLQPLPSVRASWKVTGTDLLWAAVSRAIRAPTPFDRDVQAGGPPPLLVGGGSAFESEKLTAYEIGYRGQPTPNTSLSISTYYHHYTALRSEAFTATFFPIVFANNTYGNTYGVEVWGSYKPASWWNLSLGFKIQHENLTFAVPIPTGVFAPFAVVVAPLLVNQIIGFTGDDATHQIALRSSMDLRHGITLDAELREVGSLPNPAVPGYVELNANVGWQVTKEFKLSLTGSNLLHSRHVEFIVPPDAVELQRSVMVRAQRTF